MRLSTFIRDEMEAILVEWEAFARTLLPAAGTMNSLALRDHARQMLMAVAVDIETSQSPVEQREKSQGLQENPTSSAATTHGGLRHDVGFNLAQLVAEFRALRASVLRLWAARNATPLPEHLEEMTRFNESIDQAIADSVAQYSEELGRARDTFTAILGHDLRSPLSAIVMSAHNIASTRLSPEQTEKAVTTISKSALAMKNMIRDLLDFAGSRLGRSMPVSLEHSRLDTVCNLALNEVMAIYPKRNFEFEAEGDLYGDFDPGRVGQVLSNLLNNAVNHGESTKPVRMAARGDPDTLSVRVTNHGPPIAAEKLKSLFQQTPSSRNPPGPGSSGLGLGLYIANEIAGAHAGSISVHSVSEATTFTLKLPRHQDMAAAAS